MRMIVVLMGVSGSGKTTISELLAGCMGVVFADADDYHSAANKAEMAGGSPLTDEDREPWLETLNALLLGYGSGNTGVLAAYQTTLTRGLPDGAVRLVWLYGSNGLNAGRLARRENHYLNPKLLDSELSTLEPPVDALRVVNDKPPGEIVDQIVKQLAE
jgi:gluconokinase